LQIARPDFQSGCEIAIKNTVEMKTKKKTPNKIATVEGKKRLRGRPKNKVPKDQCPFYLPVGLIEVINENCRGNKSVFAEEVFKFYFDEKGIDYRRE